MHAAEWGARARMFKLRHRVPHNGNGRRRIAEGGGAARRHRSVRLLLLLLLLLRGGRGVSKKMLCAIHSKASTSGTRHLLFACALIVSAPQSYN